MHDQVHENGDRIDSIGLMLAIMMDALEIAHPKDEVPDAPDLSTLVDQWVCRHSQTESESRILGYLDAEDISMVVSPILQT